MAFVSQTFTVRTYAALNPQHVNVGHMRIAKPSMGLRGIGAPPPPMLPPGGQPPPLRHTYVEGDPNEDICVQYRAAKGQGGSPVAPCYCDNTQVHCKPIQASAGGAGGDAAGGAGGDAAGFFARHKKPLLIAGGVGALALVAVFALS